MEWSPSSAAAVAGSRSWKCSWTMMKEWYSFVRKCRWDSSVPRRRLIPVPCRERESRQRRSFAAYAGRHGLAVRIVPAPTAGSPCSPLLSLENPAPAKVCRLSLHTPLCFRNNRGSPTGSQASNGLLKRRIPSWRRISQPPQSSCTHSIRLSTSYYARGSCQGVL